MDETMERRKYPRSEKNLVISYCEDKDPLHYSSSQIKNISAGGTCFITTKALQPRTKVRIDLKTPCLTKNAQLEATVLESIAEIPGILYKIRACFDNLDQEARGVIEFSQ